MHSAVLRFEPLCASALGNAGTRILPPMLDAHPHARRLLLAQRALRPHPLLVCQQPDHHRAAGGLLSSCGCRTVQALQPGWLCVKVHACDWPAVAGSRCAALTFLNAAFHPAHCSCTCATSLARCRARRRAVPATPPPPLSSMCRPRRRSPAVSALSRFRYSLDFARLLCAPLASGLACLC